jgi:hypothetical protein
LAHLIRDAGQTLVHETVGRYEHGYKPEAPLRLHDGWVYDEQDA